jgi:hypothetical protein
MPHAFAPPMQLSDADEWTSFTKPQYADCQTPREGTKCAWTLGHAGDLSRFARVARFGARNDSHDSIGRDAKA